MVIYRFAGAEDTEKVYKLICELENDILDLNSFREIFLANIADENIIYLMAEADGEAVGFGSLHIQKLLHHMGLAAEIQELVVCSKFQGHGIGGEIVTQLEKEAAQRGCLLIEVCCNRKREKSHLFYEKQGFLRSHFKFTRELLPDHQP